MDLKEISELIKERAVELGFDACGISKVDELQSDGQFLKNWLDKGLHASMEYMANNFEKRIDPRKLLEGAKSVISVVLNYFPDKLQEDRNAPVVSKYAYGTDYHFVIKEKLNKLYEYIRINYNPSAYRLFTDSAPVLDRAWAARGGLGWIGKNTNLIVPGVGSFVFIGEIILDIELNYDSPIEDRCGTCTKCISACPTNALVMPYLLDSNRCISYQTIENRSDIPQHLKGKFENRVFGCDICQDICPWNRKVIPTKEKAFSPSKKLLELTKEEWYKLKEDTYKEVFRKSAVKRTKFVGLKRNIDFLKESQ